MTKKDYIKFANMLKNSRKILNQRNKKASEYGRIAMSAEGMLKAIERDIADIFAFDSPRFDYTKFMEYIGHN